MIKITNITLKNFLSVGNATQAIKLDQNGMTLVLGHNTDANGGTTRNGAGKSTILQAISYGLFGKPLTKIRIPNLVNNINNKQMLVTLEFERDGVTYRIERGQKPAVMRFFVNNTQVKEDEEDVAQGENRHTQTEIENLIGMSHQMFRHIVALNTFTPPFLTMSVSEQRAIIEELLGVTQISHRAETLKRLINETKESIRDQEATIRATTEANARIETAIKQASANATAWATSHTLTMEELAEAIKAVENIDYDAEIAAFDRLDAYARQEHELNLLLDSEQKEVSRYEREAGTAAKEAAALLRRAADLENDGQITRLQAEITRKSRDAERHLTNVSKFKAEKVSLETDLANADAQICVCCGQALTGTDHLETVIAKITGQITDLDKKIAREEKEAKDRSTEVAAIEAEIEAAKVATVEQKATFEKQSEGWTEKAEAALAMKAKHAQQVAIYKETLALLGEKPVVAFKSRDEVYKAKQMYDTLVRDLEQEGQKENPFSAQMESLKAALQAIDFEPLNELNVLYKHQDFLLRLLTNKDSFIRKRIIDQNLSYLNTRLNHYLDKLGLPHEVRFLSDLSVEISLLGREFDFEQLSRGEMNRVIMATSWSFRDVWESLNTGFNLLWVDEMLDQGTDSQGVEAAIAILKSMARDRKKNVFLISHRDELISRIDHTLMVRKDAGFTRFEHDTEVV